MVCDKGFVEKRMRGLGVNGRFAIAKGVRGIHLTAKRRLWCFCGGDRKDSYIGY